MKGKEMSSDGHIIAEALDRNTEAIRELRELIDRIWFGERDKFGETDGYDGVVHTIADAARLIRQEVKCE